MKSVRLHDQRVAIAPSAALMHRTQTMRFVIPATPRYRAVLDDVSTVIGRRFDHARIAVPPPSFVVSTAPRSTFPMLLAAIHRASYIVNAFCHTIIVRFCTESCHESKVSLGYPVKSQPIILAGLSASPRTCG
jgi:hypothetical protein